MTEQEKDEREELRKLRNEALNQMGEAIKTEMDLVTSKDGPNSYIKSIATQLRLHGVKTMRIEFAGGGDIGQIDSINIIDNDGENASQYAYQSQGEILFKVLENWAYEFLDINNQTNWYNNEGGGGHIQFDLENSKFDWEVYYNEIITEVGSSGEEDI